MNVYMQPKSPLNINLGETQSPNNSRNTRILYPSKDGSHEVETDVEAIWEVENQSGDTLPVENI